MALADYQTLVPNLVRDDSGKITEADRDEAITRAAMRYSKDRPRGLVVDLVSAGGNLLDLPAGWQADFSAIRELEHPIGDVPPTLIPPDEWQLYETPGGTRILLLNGLSAGAQVRCRFTVAHTLDAGTDTIPETDREAVACWAAALLLDQLAALFAGAQLSTIPADTIDHGGKSGNYAARANALRKRYFDELGLDPKRNVAAGAVVNLDPTDSLGRKERLTHPVRYR